MNRFHFCEARLSENESFVAEDRNIKLYNGDEKTEYEDGDIVLTSHRILWGRNGEIARGGNTLALNLSYVTSVDEEDASSRFFGKKKRIVLKLGDAAPHNTSAPIDSCNSKFVKISGSNGIDPAFLQALRATVNARVWEMVPILNMPSSCLATENTNDSVHNRLRTGIMGIERKLADKQKQTDINIAVAFQDLSKLMAMAKNMVSISKVISVKIRDRHGEISEDETVRFKSYLMSLGINDPVTRDGTRSNSEYFQKLSRQLCKILFDPISDAGGMMSLAEVYCRVNRARGFELLSPEDLFEACKLLTGPMKIRIFASGATVLQLKSHHEKDVSQRIVELVKLKISISADELARLEGISFLLARERLLASEISGRLCRDESFEGLRFYINKFIS